MSEKTCDVKGCENSFDQKAKGRGRITKKRDQGEYVAWICPFHQSKIDSKIEWRGQG